MAEPIVTVYAPERHGDRWTARAEVRARGELVELTATASDRLARQAASWYHRGERALRQWVQYRGGAEPGAGAFGALGELGAELAMMVPADPEADAAAQLLASCAAGDPAALEHASRIAELADSDADAARALELLAAVDEAATCSPYEVPALFARAHSGEGRARALLGCLHALRPPSACPVRLSYDVADYLADADALRGDLCGACADEFGARILAPHGRTARRVRPSLVQPMLRTFQLAAAYRGNGDTRAEDRPWPT